MKNVLRIHRSGERHWVGDGFPVRTVFSYQELGPELTPFLLLDHAGPADFSPTTKERGVGWHPHRGFETVTIVYEGEVEHADTAGNRGRIGPGDVQWMTAGAGVLHKELHAPDFARRGGRFEVLQLWVNLPAASKLTTPSYQSLGAATIPAVRLPGHAGSLRVIAGEFGGATGPARTVTPIGLFDVRLHAGHRVEFALRDGCTGAVFVAHGALTVNGRESVREGELAVFGRTGDEAAIEATAEAVVLVMHGQPIDEPIVGYGPFVMNTPHQIRQAFADYGAGRMGAIPALTR
jgi:redox-sensitive bicupin YhaK (pirin superfamily)